MGCKLLNRETYQEKLAVECWGYVSYRQQDGFGMKTTVFFFLFFWKLFQDRIFDINIVSISLFYKKIFDNITTINAETISFLTIKVK